MALTRKETLLLKEYELLTQHYQHEDRLLEQRNYFFIIINLALLTAFRFLAQPGTLQSIIQATKALTLTGKWWPLVVCIIGASMSILWLTVILGGMYWLSLRKKQAESIEKELGYLTTYQAEIKLCDERQVVVLRGVKLQPMPRFYLPATKASVGASGIFALLWVVMLCLTITGRL